MKKIILFIVSIGILVVLGYLYINQDHRNISEEEPSHTIEAETLINEFQNNTDENELKYLNNTIEIQGELTAIQENSLVLNKTIYCEFDATPSISETTQGTRITIKGRLIGFDDLLGELKLDQCTVITNKNL